MEETRSWCFKRLGGANFIYVTKRGCMRAQLAAPTSISKIGENQNKKRQVFSIRRRTMTDSKPNETSLALLKTLMDSLAHEIVAFDSHDPRRIDLLQELLLLNELAAEMRKKRMPVIIQRK